MSESIENPLAPVRLWTGHEVRGVIVVTVFQRLRHLLSTRPMAFIDLADFAHKPDFEIPSDTLQVLPADWSMGRSMSRDILLTLQASISGDSDSDDLRLLNPLTGR